MSEEIKQGVLYIVSAVENKLNCFFDKIIKLDCDVKVDFEPDIKEFKIVYKLNKRGSSYTNGYHYPLVQTFYISDDFLESALKDECKIEQTELLIDDLIKYQIKHVCGLMYDMLIV